MTAEFAEVELADGCCHSTRSPKSVNQFRIAVQLKSSHTPGAGLAPFFGTAMPKEPGQQRAAINGYLQQAREAMELAERASSASLREELLRLAMKWLELASKAEE